MDLTDFTNNVAVAKFKDGSQIQFNLPNVGLSQSPSGPVSVIASSLIDSNGNLTTIGQNGNTTTITDSNGRAVTIAPPASGLGYIIQYQNSNGQTENITLGNLSYYQKSPTPTFSAPAVNSNILAGGVGIKPAGPSWIVLPNGLTYTFQYNNYGEIIKITYPSGGYTRYDYQAFPKAQYEWTSGVSNYADERDVVAKYVCRTSITTAGATSPSGYVNGTAENNCPVPEDTTTYTRTPTNATTTAATVVDPMGNQTVYSFNASIPNYAYQNTLGLINVGLNTIPLETSRVTYQGTSTVLSTVNTAYVSPLTQQSSVLPFSRTTILPTGQQSQTQWVRDYSVRTVSPTVLDRGVNTSTTYQIQTGNLLEQRDYDFGQGAVGPLLKTTDYTWLQTNPVNSADYTSSQIYILDRKLSEKVFDGSGNQKAQTTYEYDNYTGGIVISGAAQHGTVANSYGPTYTTCVAMWTAVNRWRSTDGAYLTNRNVQSDDAGNVLVMSDPAGH